MAHVVDDLAVVTAIIDKNAVGAHVGDVHTADGETMHVLEIYSAGAAGCHPGAGDRDGLYAQVAVGRISITDDVPRLGDHKHGALPFYARAVMEKNRVGGLVSAVF